MREINISMNKKPTAKDVAIAAGVSVATVSYVLNNKEGQKISEDTRKKVLQMANLLHYVPSHEAKSLATGKNNLIGILYHIKEESPSRNLEIMHLVNLLVERFGRMNYSTIIIPYDQEAADMAPNRMLDGIIAIDIPEDGFKRIADKYYVPVICMDMIVNDFLFYQIYTDMQTLSLEAREYLGDDFFLLTDTYDNEKYQKYICSIVPKDRVIFLSELNEDTARKLKGRKVLVNGAYLALVLKQFVEPKDIAVLSYRSKHVELSNSVKIIHNDVAKKANMTMNIMLNAFEQKFDITHDFKIC